MTAYTVDTVDTDDTIYTVYTKILFTLLAWFKLLSWKTLLT